MTIYYLGLRYTSETNTRLSQLRDSITPTYTSPKLGFHTTIMYSKEFGFSVVMSLTDIPPFTITPKFDVFGRHLVLTFDNEILTYLHNECLASGGHSDFKPYIPHITLAENIDPTVKVPIKFEPIELSPLEFFTRVWEEKC